MNWRNHSRCGGGRGRNFIMVGNGRLCRWSLRRRSEEELPSTFTLPGAPGDPHVRFFVFLWYILYERAAPMCSIRPNRALYPTSKFH